jgi:hypothetical protein
MPAPEVQKLRNSIMDKMGLDIYELPPDIVKDKSKLDAILREHLAKKSTFGDKFYEYWINAILSGPTTHWSNLYGNTANAAYELGIKRFTEALVNTMARRKDGATFGEFKEMLRAWNWTNAWRAAKQSFDLEVLDTAGKFVESHNTAIGGKTGRVVRTPGRALKAADAFAKALFQPMETAAYAYRLGKQQGLTGKQLQEFIQKELTDKNSKSYDWGRKRAEELTFQEDPGEYIKKLMALRESSGIGGTIARFTLPFIKTPYNIIGQGLRKSPLGSLNLLYQTGKGFMGKRKFDGQYVGLVAEQLIAWGAFMALYGLSDDDELPIITGANAPYGSAEYGFKANKVPPYSIRIGNTWISYARIEPLATGLSVIADDIQALKEAKSGKDGRKVITEVIGKTGKSISDKSFVDSVGELVEVLQDPDKNFWKSTNNLAASAVPNIWRQTRNSFEDNIADGKSRERGLEFIQDQFTFITNKAGITTGIPKIDYFGREVKKDAFDDSLVSALVRLNFPAKVQSGFSDMDDAEQLIWNYNQRNPESAWYPSIPQHTFTHKKEEYYFSGENYTNYAKDAGQLAHKQIQNEIKAGRLNVKNPTEKDIKLIKNIFEESREKMKVKHFKNAKKWR